MAIYKVLIYILEYLVDWLSTSWILGIWTLANWIQMEFLYAEELE